MDLAIAGVEVLLFFWLFVWASRRWPQRSHKEAPPDTRDRYLSRSRVSEKITTEPPSVESRDTRLESNARLNASERRPAKAARVAEQHRQQLAGARRRASKAARLALE